MATARRRPDLSADVSSPEATTAEAVSRHAKAPNSKPANSKPANSKPARPTAKKASPAKKKAPPGKKAPAKKLAAAAPKKTPGANKRPPKASPRAASKRAAMGDTTAPAETSGVPETSAEASAGSPPGDRFLPEARDLLLAERATYAEQAESLKAEADLLVQEAEPGDIQFDEESGEGGTMAVDRERDLALAGQAQAAVEEIDHALAKLGAGDYGICEQCRERIPRPRLKALPYARLCVACKSGGLSRR